VSTGPPGEARNTFVELAVAVSEQWDTSAQIKITTTEAALRNILHTHLEALTAKDAWVPPLTLVVPIGVALLAGLESSTAEDFLYVCLGGALLWLAATAKRAFRYRGHEGIDAVIDELRPGTRPPRAWAPGVFERLWRSLFGGPAK
jgi:hypothetical protein